MAVRTDDDRNVVDLPSAQRPVAVEFTGSERLSFVPNFGNMGKLGADSQWKVWRLQPARMQLNRHAHEVAAGLCLLARNIRWDARNAVMSLAWFQFPTL